MWKDVKMGATLASSGMEFQSLRATTEKAVSHVPTTHICEGSGTSEMNWGNCAQLVCPT